ncbi:MAG: tetratricopeptide repeat protein [Cucumibacter sp.]
MIRPNHAIPALIVLLSLAIAPRGLGGEGSDPELMELRLPSSSGSFLAGRGASVDRRHDIAAQFYLEALNNDWNNPLLVDRAFISLAAAGDITRAAASAQRLIELQPDHELARLLLGAVALKERRYTSAVNLLDAMSTSTLLGITGNVLDGWAMFGAGRIEEAEDRIGSIEEEGFAEFLQFHRGLMADLAGDEEEALRLLGVAYEGDPLVFRIVEAYARTLANSGDFGKAGEVLDAFAASGLTHPLTEIVADAVASGRRPGKFAENVQEGAAEMLLGLGTAIGSENVSDLGILFLRLALYLDPDADVVSITLGDMLERAGRFETANLVYDEVAPESPLRMSAIIAKSLNLEELGERADAIASLRNIANLHPDSLEAVYALGDILRADKEYEAAAEAYTRALDISGGEAASDWRYYYVRGISWERAKLWDRAEPDFRKALELNPEQPQVLNYLGYSWVDQGLNLDEALGMIETAVDLRPSDGYIIDSLGWAYYRLGRFEEALATLVRAVLLMPDDPTINDHLGDALWRVGRKLEARYQWAIARDLGPDEPGMLERIDRKLAVGLDAVLEAEAATPEGDQAAIEADQ